MFSDGFDEVCADLSETENEDFNSTASFKNHTNGSSYLW